MKRIFTLACVAMLTLCASAQVTFNAKLGGGMSWAPMSEKGSEVESSDNKGLFVGKIGFGAEIPVSQNFSVMPSLELAMKGGKYEFKDMDETQKLNITYLQIPVFAAYRLSLTDRLNMTLKAGPYFAYGLSGNVKNTSDGPNGDTKTEKIDIFSDKEMGGKAADRFDVGGILGVDFEYHRFVFGAELECGFTDMFKSTETYEDYNYSVKIKNLAAYVTVGYKF